MSKQQVQVGIILGSKSDLPAFDGCIEMLEKFDVAHELVIHSAHRNPDDVRDWACGLVDRGIKVVIAGAGKAAALGGVVAAYTPLPVIAVPMKTSDLGGMDSLLSTVQMPTGVPLATVAIGATKNAAILATEILGVGDTKYRTIISAYKRELAES